MRSICDECGSDSVDTRRVEGVLVSVCALCGALSGDPDALARIERVREARDAGVDVEVWELHRELDRLDGVKVVGSYAGDADAHEWPFVQLAIAGGPDSAAETDAIVTLDNLMKSLTLTAGAVHAHWVVEVEYRNRLLFTLKPRFHREPTAIDSTAIRGAIDDLGTLAAAVRRDRGLSFWRRRQG